MIINLGKCRQHGKVILPANLWQEDPMATKSRKPLPLSDILRDLALLRASALGIPEIFKAAKQDSDVISPTSSSPESIPSVAASYNYVATVRAAIKLKDSGKLEAEGKKIEDARNKYEELDVCYVAFG
jgi:hypothetical protein